MKSLKTMTDQELRDRIASAYASRFRFRYLIVFGLLLKTLVLVYIATHAHAR